MQPAPPAPAAAQARAQATDPTAIAAGFRHACMIRSGTAYCWGDNSGGATGTGSVLNEQVPPSGTPSVVGGIGTPRAVYTGGVLKDKRLVQITAGNGFTCALDSAGAAYCWGSNAYGQLGDNTALSSGVPVAVSTARLPANRHFTQLSAAENHVCALDDGGAAYCWGSNAYGQLGNGNAASRSSAPVAVAVAGLPAGQFTQVSAGGATSCALRGAGAAYCWGRNSNGQLGCGAGATGCPDPGANSYTRVPVAVSAGATTFTQLSVGYNHTCARSTATNNPAYCWGDGRYGALGNNGTADQRTPVAVVTTGELNQKALTRITSGYQSSCVLSAGRAYCWGYNAKGQLGNATTNNSNVPVAVNVAGVLNARNLDQISTGGDQYTAPGGTGFSCALDTTGAAYCWGYAGFGGLGNPSVGADRTVPVAVTAPRSTTVAASGDFSCMIRVRRAYCWGANQYGQLGNGNNSSSTVPVAVSTTRTFTQISVGNGFACALDSTGAAYCWGLNSSGQLGDNSTTNRNAPVAVVVSGVLAGKVLVDISAASGHACAVDTTGGAYCWGANGSGQLGDNSTTNHNAPVAVGGLGGKVLIQVSAGYTHTCAVDTSGAGYCWGSNSYGQLGCPDAATGANLSCPTPGPGGATAAYSSAPVAITPPPGNVMAGKPLASINAGNQFTCAVDTAGKSYCWGLNDGGQLGGTTGANGARVPGQVYLPSTPGEVGTAVDLSGHQEYVKLPDNINNGLNAFTIALWVKPTANWQWSRVFDFGSGNTTYMFLTLFPGANAGPRFAISTNGPGSEQQISSNSGALALDTWSHVAVTLTGNNTGTLYVNGAVVGTNTNITLRPSDLNNTNQNWIGRSQFSADAFGRMTVDDFQIYNSALSAAAIKALDDNRQPGAGNVVNYKFDDSPGSTALDSSGMGRHATIITPAPMAVATSGVLAGTFLTSVTAGDTSTCALDTAGHSYCWGLNDSGQLGGANMPRVPGAIDKALPLSQDGQYVSMPDGIVKDLRAFTIAAWVNPAVNRTWSRVFDFGTGTTAYMFLTVNVGSNGPLRFAITTNGQTAEQRIDYSGQLPLNTWSHVTVTLSENTSPADTYTGRLYVNGVERGSKSDITLTPASLGATTNNWIGRSQYTPPDPYLAATVDDFRIYNRALTGAQVSDLYKRTEPSGVPADALVTHYKFEEPDGSSTAVDSSGNGRNGTIIVAQSNVPVPVNTDGALAGVILTQVNIEYRTTCAMGATGALYCWGGNGSGQIGDNSTRQRYMPVAVEAAGAPGGVAAFQGSCDATTCGADVHWAASRPPQSAGARVAGYTATAFPLLPAAATPRTCDAGSATTVTCTITGLTSGISYLVTVVAHTYLSAGTAAPLESPVSAMATVTVWAPPITLSAGGSHTCTTSAGSAYCWGGNTYGQLGDDSTTASKVPAATSGMSGVTAISAGARHTCAVRDTGAAYCWGDNTYGQLGNASTTASRTPVPVSGLTGVTAISAGARHTCAVTSAGAAYCWGDASQGELGSGQRGGIATTPQPVSGLQSGTRQISAGGTTTAPFVNHTCAVGADGAYCWGDNSRGQVGNGTSGAGFVSNLPVRVTGGALANRTVVQVTAGGASSCALDSAGLAYCWGDNAAGQLGCGPTGAGSCANPGTLPAAVYTGTASAPGVLWGRTLARISAGGQHTCAVGSDGHAYCWGSNASDQLGCGGSPGCGSSNVPVAATHTAVLYGKVLPRVTAGAAHTCVLDTDRTAYCWGLNQDGQLGTDTTANRTAAWPVSPQAPKITSATAGVRSAFVQWTLPVPMFLNNATVTGYRATAVADSTSRSCDTGATARSCTIADLAPGAMHTITVTLQAEISGVAVTATSTPEIIGLLTISVPAGPESFGVGTVGGSVSGDVGPVTVTDGRVAGDAVVQGNWTTSVAVSDFVLRTATGPVACTGGRSCTIPAAGNVTYTIPAQGQAGAPVATPGSAQFTYSAEGVPLANTTTPVLTAVGAVVTNWTPRVAIRIPMYNMVPTGAGEYFQGTITHSVY